MLSYFSFTFSPSLPSKAFFCLAPKIRKTVSSGFRRSLEVCGNKHPRFSVLDQIEQLPILVGRPVTSAVLYSHHDASLTSSPSAPQLDLTSRNIAAALARAKPPGAFVAGGKTTH
jgi:hypothetical protein